MRYYGHMDQKMSSPRWNAVNSEGYTAPAALAAQPVLISVSFGTDLSWVSRVHDAGTHDQLWFATTDDVAGVNRSIRVHQDHPTWMLGLRRPHQPPHRRTGQILDILTGPTDRPPSHHHQHT